MKCQHCGTEVERDSDAEWWLRRAPIYAESDGGTRGCTESPDGEHRPAQAV